MQISESEANLVLQALQAKKERMLKYDTQHTEEEKEAKRAEIANLQFRIREWKRVEFNYMCGHLLSCPMNHHTETSDFFCNHLNRCNHEHEE